MPSAGTGLRPSWRCFVDFSRPTRLHSEIRNSRRDTSTRSQAPATETRVETVPPSRVCSSHCWQRMSRKICLRARQEQRWKQSHRLTAASSSNEMRSARQTLDRAPHRAEGILIRQGDANNEIREMCGRGWRRHRAVLFLGPFGMQVEWETIEAIAATRAIDLWLLFPLGIGVKRLKGVFTAVIKQPGVLRNSANNPLYLLCFAIGNEREQQIGLDIAKHLLRDLH